VTTTDSALGDLLVRESLMTPAQLKTALEFQKSLGGDLRNIVVKLGYVKDNVLAGLVAQEENVSASSEITPDVLDFEAIKLIPRAVLEKHQVVPLKGDGTSLVLAMSDPNDLRAVEEIQFLVNKPVEPAVATKAAIRKTLNQLNELVKAQEAAKSPKSAIPPDRLKALASLSLEKLMRAYVLTQIEKGVLTADELLARAGKL
jgi:type IV pilus assembly protein PilB